MKQDPKEVYQFFKHIDDETDEITFKKKKKFRSYIRDNAMMDVCLNEKMKKLTKLDLGNCGISNETCFYIGLIYLFIINDNNNSQI